MFVHRMKKLTFRFCFIILIRNHLIKLFVCLLYNKKIFKWWKRKDAQLCDACVYLWKENKTYKFEIWFWIFCRKEYKNLMKNYVWYDNGIYYLSLSFIHSQWQAHKKFRKINTKNNLALHCLDFLMHSNVHICFVFYFHWINDSGLTRRGIKI